MRLDHLLSKERRPGDRPETSKVSNGGKLRDTLFNFEGPRGKRGIAFLGEIALMERRCKAGCEAFGIAGCPLG